VPDEFEHSAFVPEPLKSEWQFECEQVCDVKHWQTETDGVKGQNDREKVKQVAHKLANPLPQEEEEEVKVTAK